MIDQCTYDSTQVCTFIEKVYDIFKMTHRSALLFSELLIMENQFFLYFPLII